MAIKQEPMTDCDGAESQEGSLFQGISVKDEFYPNHNSSDEQIPIYASQYFSQADSQQETPLDIKFVTQNHELYNGQNGWNVQENSESPQASKSKKANTSKSKKDQLNNIKQEPAADPEETHMFQSMSFKQEFYPHQSTSADAQIPIYHSNNFNQPKVEPSAPAGIKFVIQNHEYEVNPNCWNVPSNSEQSPCPPETKVTPVKAKNSRSKSNKNVENGANTVSPQGPEKPKRKIDRFNGVPEEEVAKKFLPDHLAQNLDILIIGINPGLYAAHVGHHYAGPGNHFWKCMFLSGIITEPFNAYDDFRMLEYGIGFTNIVARTTRGSADLSKQEIKEGSEILKTKIQQYKPRIAVFNGKTIYEIYSGKKQFCFGKQPETIEGTDTHIWVMPSSSARCAQLPRAIDKVPFYEALRKFRDYLIGKLAELDEAEVVFTNVKLTNVKKVPKLEVPKIEKCEVESPRKARHSPQKRKSEGNFVSPKK